MQCANPLNESNAASARTQVAQTARALGVGALPFLEGIRKLVGLRFEATPDPFMLFAAIASQADHIPNAAARALCAASWLEQCDNEVRELESFYAREVSAACKQLVQRFT